MHDFIFEKKKKKKSFANDFVNKFFFRSAVSLCKIFDQTEN